MNIKLTIALLTLSLISASCAKNMPIVNGDEPNAQFKACMQLSAKGKFEDAVQCLEMFKARYPQTRLGREAELRIGDAYFSKKEYLLAAESYSAFIRLHPNSNKSDYAYYRMGLSYYKESPKSIDRDQEYLEKAIKKLKIAVKYYPNSPYYGLAHATLNVARKKVARRNFYIGNFYFKTGEYIACISRFWTVVNDYGDLGMADRALYKIIIASLKLGKLSDAKEAFGVLSSNYPNSKYAKRAEKKLLHAAKKEQKKA